MTRDDLRAIMHEYLDGRLSEEESSRVKSFLEEYEEVAKEYSRYKRLLDSAKNLSTGIEIPKKLLNVISDELLSKSIEKLEIEKQNRLREISEGKDKTSAKEVQKNTQTDGKITYEQKPAKKISRNWIKTPLILLIILLIVIGGYFTYDYFSNNLPWRVKAVKGTFQINNQSLQTRVLDINQTLSTRDSSIVQVNIPQTGRIELLGKSSIKLLKGKENDNKIFFLSGKIKLNTRINDPGVTVVTSAATIEDLGGNFSVEFDNFGSVIVVMGKGLANIVTPVENLILIRQYSCKILNNGMISIPYHNETSVKIIDAVNSVSFNKMTDEALKTILNEAKYLDGITLWYLLKQSGDKYQSKLIFNKLNELFPVPPGVTQEGVFAGDNEMIQIWHDDIEWQI